jgi:hypothetical protein
MASLKIEKVNVVARWSHIALTETSERSTACNLCKKDVTLAVKGEISVDECGSRFHSECWNAFASRRAAEGAPNPACTQCHKPPRFVTLEITKGE